MKIESLINAEIALTAKKDRIKHIYVELANAQRLVAAYENRLQAELAPFLEEVQKAMLLQSSTLSTWKYIGSFNKNKSLAHCRYLVNENDNENQWTRKAWLRSCSLDPKVISFQISLQYSLKEETPYREQPIAGNSIEEQLYNADIFLKSIGWNLIDDKEQP